MHGAALQRQQKYKAEANLHNFKLRSMKKVRNQNNLPHPPTTDPLPWKSADVAWMFYQTLWANIDYVAHFKPQKCRMSIEICLFIDDAVAAMRHCWPTAIHAKEHRRN